MLRTRAPDNIARKDVRVDIHLVLDLLIMCGLWRLDLVTSQLRRQQADR